MYHYIQEWDGQSQLVAGLTVSPDKFRSQLLGLESLGYSFISMDGLYHFLVKKEYQKKNIVLTFDDGYEDFYSFAYPILKEKGTPAIVFIITDYIGKPGYLNWQQIKEMDGSGIITIGSHNMEHISLSSASKQKAEYEISQSKKVLEDGLGHEVNYFCYPNGEFNFDISDMVKNSKYDLAVSTIQDIKQTWTDRFWLPRIRIGSSYTGATIDYKIRQFEK
jgi:peptidoglycan/xylan/chitin deacetylase (PgdA/CDA1 family)